MIPLDDFCKAGKEIGLQSVELLEVKGFPHAPGPRPHICAMVSGVPGGITSGLNRLENHDKIAEYFRADHPARYADAGYPNIILLLGQP